MAIYNSKITKTPEDIEQINITSNRVKNDNYFHVFHLFMYWNHTFFLPFSPTDTHTQYRHAFAHKRGQKLVSAAPQIYQRNGFAAETLHDISQ